MKRFITFLSIFILVSAVVFAQVDNIVPVAVVRLFGTDQISVGELKAFVQEIEKQQRGIPLEPDKRREALDRLVNSYLLAQAAAQAASKKEIQDFDLKKDNDIRKWISDQILQTNGGRSPSKEEVEEEFGEFKKLSNANKEQIRRSVLVQRYVEKEKNALLEAARKPPTEAEIQKIYNDYKSVSFLQGGLFQPESVEVRMFVIPFQNESQKAKAKAKADSIAKQIGNDPKEFDKVDAATPKTLPANITGNEVTCTTSNMFDDDVMRNRYGSAFVNYVLKLKQGEVSRVLEGADGFIIMKVTRNIPSVVPSLADTRQNIINTVIQRNYLIAQQKAMEELVAEKRKNKGAVQIMDDIYSQISW